MAKKKTTEQQSVADVLGALTKEKIAQVADAHLKETLQEAYAFASGVATALLGDPADPKIAAAQAALASVHISLDDATGTANDALTLLAEIADRDVKSAAWHVAVGEVTATDRAIGSHLGSYTLLLRGKLGPKSPDLVQFGIKPIAPGGRHAKKAAAGGAVTTTEKKSG